MAPDAPFSADSPDPAVPPDVVPLLEDQAALYQDALDYLDHAGLCAFLSLEQVQRDSFLEEVANITAQEEARRAARYAAPAL